MLPYLRVACGVSYTTLRAGPDCRPRLRRFRSALRFQSRKPWLPGTPGRHQESSLILHQLQSRIHRESAESRWSQVTHKESARWNLTSTSLEDSHTPGAYSDCLVRRPVPEWPFAATPPSAMPQPMPQPVPAELFAKPPPWTEHLISRQWTHRGNGPRRSIRWTVLVGWLGRPIPLSC
jgi:hypothetical protein